MAIVLLGNAQITANANGGTSASLDTSGANLIVVHVSQYNGATLTTPSDNKSNGVPSALTAQSGAVESYSRLFYWLNPTVGTGHTFTVANTGIFAVSQIAWFSGVDSYDSLQNGAVNANASSIQPGSSGTPSANGALIVSGTSNNSAIGTQSIDSSFNITNQTIYGAAVNEGGALAYIIQSSLGAVNPTWTLGQSCTNACATIAVFKATASSGVTYPQLERFGFRGERRGELT